MTSPKPMSDDSIGKRIDALMKRQGSARAVGEVPVLTEIVNDERGARPAMDKAALEALARELERAVLERLGPEVHRVIEEKIAQKLNTVLGQALENVRADLTISVIQMVREAVAASVVHALARPDKK
jgi:hypothetical protein